MDHASPRHRLRVLASLRAAREFGLDPLTAADVARRVDPRTHGWDALADALAAELLDGETVRVPDSV